ncbi:maleylacetate reductase [Pseudonocardia lutea]|uniref:Maleylacetate reductase n=1 Tax=Pseudonocardia lutea TaxID=2172015 RepID=A0ABW1I1F4_9PSEU
MQTRLHYSHDTVGGRLLFGAGSARDALSGELDRLGATRALLVADVAAPDLLQRITEPLADRIVVTLTDVRQHVPIEQAEAARAAARDHDVEAIITVGGGSATGLGKAVALTRDVPIISVPTTYAGSELTPIWGLTEARRKSTGRDERVRPKVVVYDPELLTSLPAEVATASAFNALAHCYETLWASATTPVARMYALEGIEWVTTGLRMSSGAVGDDLRRAETLLHGTYFAGTAFAITGSGLHHKICHVLGGRFGLPHAQTHTALLPHVAAFNQETLDGLDPRLAHALHASDSREGLAALYAATGAPQSLQQVGLTASQLPEAIAAVQESLPIPNPRPVTAAAVAELLTAAFDPVRNHHDH